MVLYFLSPGTTRGSSTQRQMVASYVEGNYEWSDVCYVAPETKPNSVARVHWQYFYINNESNVCNVKWGLILPQRIMSLVYVVICSFQSLFSSLFLQPVFWLSPNRSHF